MAEIKLVVARILSLVLPLIYGWIVLLILSYKAVKHGRKFFKSKITEAPKTLFDSKFGKHGYAQLKNQGVRLHFVESGDRNKPLVVLLHGFPDFWYSWRHQIPKLAENYWVVALDLRGYGESDSPKKVEAYKIKILTDDVKELITTLGRDSAIVIGHDWGGVIAWYFSMYYPDSVNKLVIANAPHPASFRSVLLKSWKQFFMSWYIFFFQLPYLPEFYLRTNNLSFLAKIYQKKHKGTHGGKISSDEELEGYMYTFSKPGAFTPPINYYRANFGSLEEKDSKIGEKVTTPSLIVWGDRDLALSKELVKATIKYCDNLKIEMIEGAGHWVHHEQPDLVNKHIENFLEI